MPERDSVDAHNERWVKYLPDLDFDIEGAVTRMVYIVWHLKRTRVAALATLDLHDHEFETLHALVGRDAPFRAGPGELATALKLSPAAMTGRLDTMEAGGLVRRLPSTSDRRKVVVELTEAGHEAWHKAMDVTGREEERILGVLTAQERRQLSDLLRRVNLAAETAKTSP